MCQDVAVHIASCEPFFSQEINDGLGEETYDVTIEARQGVALVEVVSYRKGMSDFGTLLMEYCLLKAIV